jgi:hypothetical protein
MPKKNNGYSHAKADARKNKRRQEADARQRVYDSLTVAGKMSLALARGGSKKEITRLEKSMEPKQPAKKDAPGVEVKPIEPATQPSRRVRRKATAKS